ncbi:hypothetical protein BKA70DRAFT_1417209 [Coprinopsis sp. MPI-PUGE-AT-0042]|nr:hypothetical protein BKA70DRAFT_1417209 [Coprinopsis sp. MPI-PUGE-AT-0042]
MRLLTCVIFSALATFASVLALPIHLAGDDFLASRDLDAANGLSLREVTAPIVSLRRSTYDDYATLALRKMILSELRERYMDAGIDSTGTHSEHHYPMASATSRKHHPSRSALRRLRWYARRRRTQRKLRAEDLHYKHQEIISPSILARAVPSPTGNVAPIPPPPAAANPQQQVLKMWKKRIECRVLNGVTKCFKSSRVKPNSITALDAKGATTLQSA